MGAPARDYRELAPSRDLRDVIACTWTKVAHGHGTVPIVPDGCTDILSIDGGAPFAVGPDVETRWVALADGTVIEGLRLRPGAARAIFGCRADEMIGATIPLADLVSGTFDGERWVRRRLETSRQPDRVLRAACDVLTRAPRISMDELAEGIGWNVRMLHREFVAACGYGPKHLQRILRVQRVLRARRRPLSAVAISLGFADQAHLARDFKRITGFTPTELVPQSDPELGRWLEL